MQENEKLSCGKIELICNAAQDPERGFSVKDRRYGLRKFRNVMVGSEIVDWLFKNCQGMTSRKDAYNLANELMKRELYRPISNRRVGKPFSDGTVLYVFSKSYEAGECDAGSDEDIGDDVVISSDALDDVFPEFNDSKTGVECKTRKAGIFKSHQDCFVGSEAVDWLVNHFNVSRKTAVELGQKMVNMGFFLPVNCKDFEDKNSFYRFVNQVEDGPAINEKTVVFDFSVLDINKQMLPISQFKDKVTVIVNVASY